MISLPAAASRKWTVPRRVLLERLEITWLSVARMRKTIILKLGYDSLTEDFDQSPFHMSEVGSKNAGSLTFCGCRTLALKEGHEATPRALDRERNGNFARPPGLGDPAFAAHASRQGRR